MCYEFMHACNEVLIAQISKALGADSYFMICIGQLNYLYVAVKPAPADLLEIFFHNNIGLQIIQHEEMNRIVNFPGMRDFQLVYGNTSLLDQFKQANQA